MKKRLSRTDLLGILRHGSYDQKTGRLDCTGKEQIDLISKKIIEFLCRRGTKPQDIKITIVSSTAPRAQESAAILAKMLGTEYTSSDVLRSGDGHKEDFEGALALYNSLKNEYDVVIFVTHVEYAMDFPNHFGKDQLAVNLGEYKVDNAGIVILDWRIHVVMDYLIPCYTSI